MKTSLFLTVTLASIASVLAAAIPGSTDMSHTAASNVVSQQASTGADSTAVKVASPGTDSAAVKIASPMVTQPDTKAVMKQESSAEQDTKVVMKQEPEQEPVGEGYTPFFITSPSENSSFAKGDMVKIEWANGIDGPFLIYLLTGKTASSMQNTKYTMRGDGLKGYYDWTVPKDLADGIYAFKFAYKNNGKSQESYSVQFKIESPKTA